MRKILFLSATLVILTIAIYWQVWRFDFVKLDDGTYVFKNEVVQQGLTLDNVVWAFTTLHHSNWVPLTWITYFVDYEIYGLNAGGYHVTNVIFHVLNGLLLFWLFVQMTGAIWRSFLVAVFFVVHPMHVESVAWISERKDVLSTFFWLAGLMAYTTYVKSPKLPVYLLTLFLFVLGLLSKPMIVTFPFVLLLLDYWPLNRLTAGGAGEKMHWRLVGRLVVEKIPFFTLSAIVGIVTIIAQDESQAVHSLEATSTEDRLTTAVISYVIYLRKLFWPVNLTAFYSGLDWDVSAWQLVASVLLLLAVSLACIAQARKRPFLIVGWLWFLGVLLPVSGLMQAGNQLTADRYTYVPYVGLFVGIVWLLAEMTDNVKRGRMVSSVVGAIAIAACMIVSWFQIGTWRDSETFRGHMESVNFSDDAIASRFLESGEVEEAIRYFQISLEKFPDNTHAHEGLGLAYLQTEQYLEAEEHYRIVVEEDPRDAWKRSQLGLALLKQEKLVEAKEHLLTAVKLDKNLTEALGNLATVLIYEGNATEAQKHLHALLNLQPEHGEALSNLGVALLMQGRWKEASTVFERALVQLPGDAMIEVNLAVALYQEGNVEQALVHAQAALAHDPSYEKAKEFLGRITGQF